MVRDMTKAANVAMVKQRVRHRITEQSDFADLVLSWSNIDNAYGPNANEITPRAAVEYPIGTSHPLFFSGSHSVTIAPGATVSCDPLSIDVPAGAEIAVESGIVLPVGGVTWISNNHHGPNDQQTVYTRAQVTASMHDLSTGGTLGTSPTLQQIFPPTNIRGRPRHRRSRRAIDYLKPTVGVGFYGDSILSGYCDTPANGVYGFAERALGARYAWQNMAQVSMRLQNDRPEAMPAGRRYRFASLGGVTHVVSNLGTNDIYNNRTVAQTVADYFLLADQLARRNIKLIPMTMMPRTDATNTTVDATKAARLQELDAILLSDPFGFGVVHAGSAARDTTNPQLWRKDLGAFPSNFDGTHPPDFIHAAVGAYLGQHLPPLLV
jgi:lysophospholipase L1-like esterase